MRQFHLSLILNKNTRRTMEILNTLSNSQHPVTLNSLSNDMGVTTRTLLTDMNSLKNQLPEGWQLVGEKNKGFSLHFPSKHDLDLFKKELLIDELLFQVLNGIYNDDHFSVHEWSERLFLSEYTLLRNLVPLKKLLKQYNLTLSTSPYLTIKGNEIEIRLFFFLYFYEAQTSPHVIEPTPEIKEFYQYCVDYTLTSSHLNPILQYNKSTYWLMIILKRIQNKHFVTIESELFFDHKETSLYSAHKKLALDFSKTFDLFMIEEELVFFSLITHNNYYFDYNYLLKNIYPTIQGPTEKELDQLLLKLPQFFSIDTLLTDSINIAIKSYIKNMNTLTKLSPLFQRNNPELNSYVQNKHGYLLNDCLKFISENEYFTKHMTIKYPLDVAVNFALITSTYIHQTHYLNKSILFILEGNQNLLFFIQAQAQRFANQGIAVHFISHMEVSKEIVETLHVDLVVVNYEKLYLEIDVPILKIGVIPSQNDWNTISSMIFSSPFKEPHPQNNLE